MGRELLVGPFNRVEGDLEIRLELEDGRVSAAYANSPLFRGFEMMLEGKDPRDALTITPRICGICSISQSAAAARALADAQGLTPAPGGERMAALIHGVENVADHLTHFHLFFMPDFARDCYAHHAWHDQVRERFLAIEGSAARAAVEARAELFHILGLMAGKWPHTLAIQPGGVTRTPTVRDKVRIEATLRAFRRYLERTLFGGPLEDFISIADRDALMDWTPGDAGLFLRIAQDLDLDTLGAGPGRFLSFGAYAFDGAHGFARGIVDGDAATLDLSRLEEHVAYSWMLGDAAHPLQGWTQPDEDMADPAYSWCKAPRLDGKVFETGAFARQVVDGHPLALSLAQGGAGGGGGVLARVACRLLEIARIQVLLEEEALVLPWHAAFSN